MSDPLRLILDDWTADTAATSFCLVGLYRKLDDARQASRALRAGQSSLERVQRLGLSDTVQTKLQRLRTLSSEEEIERSAWQRLVGSLCGISAFHMLAEIDKPERTDISFRGIRSALRNEVAEALKGFRTAFPVEITEHGIAHSLDHTAKVLMDALVQAAADDPPDEDELCELHGNIHKMLVDRICLA